MSPSEVPSNNIRPILRRVGILLIIAGLVDIGLGIYCITNGISYTSYLNVLSIIAGLLLLYGGARLTSIIRWLTLFYLTYLIGSIAILPLFHPLSLILLEFRLHPKSFLIPTVAMIGAIVVLCWVVRQLLKYPVVAARRAAGVGLLRLSLPAVLAGMILVVVTLVFFIYMLNGDAAEHAKQIAYAQLGSDYNYHVTTMNIEMKNGHKAVSGVVTVWSDTDMRQIPVHWEE
jgi:hypothetical protein